jgi:hypothetical protein
MKFLCLFTFLALCSAPRPALAEKAIQCARSQTLPCAQEILFANKEFQESIKTAFGKDVKAENLALRVHNAGWASFGINASMDKYVAQNHLPESYFKKSQWYFIEVSNGTDRKSFQVDLTFQAYGANTTPADWKIATVEKSRVEELEPYKVEEAIQKEIATKLPKNGFVCESEELGFIFSAQSVNKDQPSFGETLDQSLKEAKDGKALLDLGAYTMTLYDFGGKIPTLLPPKTSTEEMKLALELDYKSGEPDQYQAAFVGRSATMSFRRTITGYNHTEQLCLTGPVPNENSEAGRQRALICNGENPDIVEVSAGPKKWEKPKCSYFELNRFIP